MNLTYCPEGEEHEWRMWSDGGNLIIDCDRCADVALKKSHTGSTDLDGLDIPVSLDRTANGLLKVRSRREV